MAPRVKITIQKWQIEKALELAKQGVTKENICLATNMNIRSYYALRNRVINGNLNRKSAKARNVVDYIQAFETGYCEYFTSLEQIVYAGGLEDSKMALEILARRKHKDWGKKDNIKQEIEHKGKIDTKMEVIFVKNEDK